MTTYSLGIDVGGTFTDLVCADEAGRTQTEKILTTVESQDIGVLSGVNKLATKYGLAKEDFLSQISVVVHGTTVATNTMLEYTGALTGLITTAGFRDTIEIRRNYKEAAFDIHLPAPYQIVPRRRRLGVTERIDYAGQVVKPLAEDEVRTAVQRLADIQVEAIAVCYLFSFLNPVHELRTREIIRETLPDVYVSLSLRRSCPKSENSSVSVQPWSIPISLLVCGDIYSAWTRSSVSVGFMAKSSLCRGTAE